MSVRPRALTLLLLVLPLQILAFGVRSEAGEAATGKSSLLAALNRARRIAGLAEIVQDPQLSAGCEDHVRYLLLNRNSPLLMGLALHSENPELPGYSERGLIAANQSLIAIDAAPEAAVTAWLASVYHRTPLLRENLQRIGIAHRAEYTLADVHGGLDGDQRDIAIPYPAPRQAEVPIRAQREQPSPLPTGVREAGYPVTLQFRDEAEITAVAATLRDDAGLPVPCYVSDPVRPASAFPQGNVIAMIPQRTLRPGAAYTASVACTVDGERRSVTWNFTTRQ